MTEPTANNHKRVRFMGCPIDSLSMGQTLDQLVAWCGDDAPPRTIITVNSAILMMMRQDEPLREACVAGDLILADGMPVVWSTKLLGDGLVGRVAGVDLMREMLGACAQNGLSVYLLGAKQEVIDTLLGKFAEQHPELKIAGTRNGYFKEPDHTQIIADIRNSGADVLFIGMPTPFKELWGEKHRAELGVSLIIGVGGSFDVLGCFVKRAPLWMQKSGLEWFWRLSMEPRKMWKRYLVTNTQFLWTLGGEMVKKLFGRA